MSNVHNEPATSHAIKVNPITRFSTRHPRIIFLILLLSVAIIGSFIRFIQIDTDPENMLSHDQPDRVLHDEIKKRFGLSDMVVVGAINENGIYNTATLNALYTLSKGIKNIDGVIAQDLMSLSEVDNITQEGAGTIRFQWMQNKLLTNETEAAAIKTAVERLPLLQNTMVSADNKAAGIYIPITSKDQSYRIATEVQGLIDKIDTAYTKDLTFHITGLPVAEDTFGIQMFKQMAMSAPMAGLMIFLLLLWFFRSVPLVIAPMLMAMSVVIITMGLLIGMGNSVHIMSSMIAIFIMPIAVVDSVHYLSEFSDRYVKGGSVEDTLHSIMSHLFKPMLFTTITSIVGFASLAFTPIPPVRIFGMYIAFGIALAFLLTVSFIPAYIVSLSDKTLASMAGADTDAPDGLLARAVRAIGRFSAKFSTPIMLFFTAVLVAGAVGITKININDNPVRWFEKNHPIRVADTVLNEHFAGTYEAYLALNKVITTENASAIKNSIKQYLTTQSASASLVSDWDALYQEHLSAQTVSSKELSALISAIDEKLFEVEDENDIALWEGVMENIEQTSTDWKYFQSPEALAYIEKMERFLVSEGYVGKSNSIASLVKTIYRELNGGEESYYRVPETTNGVAQTLLSFQSSHKPTDLWHMVTPDFSSAAIWLQLPTGDNQDMAKVVEAVKLYINDNPLPAGVKQEWGGLTYINVIWQDAMVSGMLSSLISSFIAVLLMMIFLFRSVVFGVLAMIPLTVTIVAIYGIIGFIGKDYDMPIAVLSSLTLGLSVDFAIHFLQRLRELVAEKGNYASALAEMYEEPGRAISKNAIVIAVGFTPLLFAPLLPYKTVGLFLALIMGISCIVTIMLLPALTQTMSKFIFKNINA